MVTTANSGALRRGSRWVATFWVACALLPLFASGRLEAQISVTFEGSNVSSTNSTTIAAFTVPSSGLPAGDTYFVVGVSCAGGSGPNSTSTPCITNASADFVWGGTGTGPWTKITNITSGNYRALEIWQFKAPSGTSKTLAVTADNASHVVAGVWFVAGVSTTTPFGTPASSGCGTGCSGSTSPINQTVTTTANDLVLAVAAFGQSACSCSPTGDWQLQTGTSTQNAWGLGNHAVAAGTSQTMGWSTSGNDNQAYAIAAVPIHPAAASAPARKGQTIVGQLYPQEGGVAGE